MASLTAAETPRLKLKWAFGFPGVSRAGAQPTVVGGRLFVGSWRRQVYSLDAASGCIYWDFEADFGVRSAITVGPVGESWAAYFGDQGGNVYAVDANTGKQLWKTRVDDFPGATVTGAPKLYEGRLYVPVSSVEEVIGASPNYECCKFRGSVDCARRRHRETDLEERTPSPTRRSRCARTPRACSFGDHRAQASGRLPRSTSRNARSTSRPATPTPSPRRARATPSSRTISKRVSCSGRASSPRATRSTSRAAVPRR